MALYRITFQTSIIVESRDEREAQHIGYKNLVEEVRNGGSELYLTEPITTVDQLHRGERGSYPWRDSQRDLNGEPEKTVEEILDWR